jgi:hypothetical protein
VDDKPFCDCTGAAGYTNKRYHETGDIRDQWLCAEHMKPARAIFMSTERWALERDLWEMSQ